MQTGTSIVFPCGPHECWVLVVAEFIIQHEDTTSISEALSILRNKWDQLDIEVGNFMIDCQQSEENAIRAVFPDSVVYLCAFHRLQAWLPVDREHQERLE